jgi:tetrapyrrole methylase family protein/MazG family protein
LEPTLAALGVDPLPQMTLSDAVEISAWHTPPFPPDIPVLIGQVYSIPVASNLKLTLMGVYPDEHPVILVHDAGLPSQTREDLALYEIDRSKQIGLRSSLYVPPLGEGTSLEAFQNVIARLRAPDGCPWDREQTHQSLRPNLLEETYEALEALDSDDPAAMCEEFGDLLLQIVLHAQIASEYGEFTLNDVFQGIYTKIVRRHPHVFQDLDLDESDAVIKNWEKLKARERKMNGQSEKGLLDGVSLSLPSLTQGLTYQKRAARVGFEWDRIEGVLEKIAEEAAEIQVAKTLAEKESELGDLLFAVVNLARWLEVDAESALRGANQRFKRRFGHIEQRAREMKRELSEMSLEEMDRLWDEAKELGE